MGKQEISLTKQIGAGLACALLEFLTVVANASVLKLPLYMDCIWTCAASFFAPLSGILCAVCYHFPVKIFSQHDWPSLFFIICSLTVVLRIRFFLEHKKNLPFVLSFIMLIFAMAFIISIEGGIIYTINYEYFDYIEDSPDNSFIYSFFIRGIPFLISGVLGRIPINLLDKAIACTCGWGLYTLLKKIFK